MTGRILFEEPFDLARSTPPRDDDGLGWHARRPRRAAAPSPRPCYRAVPTIRYGDPGVPGAVDRDTAGMPRCRRGPPAGPARRPHGGVSVSGRSPARVNDVTHANATLAPLPRPSTPRPR